MSTSETPIETKQPTRVAIYVRYSDHQDQREESLSDQKRRCGEIAARHGWELDPTLAFSDAESVNPNRKQNRPGFQALLAAWEARKFDVLIVDEVSRLARGRVALAHLQERLEKTKVRIISCNGIDSGTPGWGFMFAIAAEMAASELAMLKFRVERGMVGALTRGRMIAYPPYGLAMVRHVKPNGDNDGTSWVVDPVAGPIVQDMYRMRSEGMSLMSIAADLNRRGIRTSQIRKPGGKFWRPASVRALLGNRIFRGVFVWNGSPFTRARVKREGIEVTTVEYDRPECRLVSDSLWEAANPVGTSWVRRGNPSSLAGLVRCGDCDGVMTLSHRGSREFLYCASCAQAVAIGAMSDYLGNIIGPVVETALRSVFESLLISDEALDAFRELLRARLSRGVDGEIDVANSRLTHARRASDRYRGLIKVVDEEELSAVQSAYMDALADCRRLEKEIDSLSALAEAQSADVVALQLESDPHVLRSALFERGLPAGRLRALLGRVFPRVVFRGKHARCGGLFEVDIAPGVMFAEASETQVLDDGTTRVLVRVDRGPKLPTTWIGQVVPSLPPANWRAGSNAKGSGAEGAREPEA